MDEWVHVEVKVSPRTKEELAEMMVVEPRVITSKNMNRLKIKFGTRYLYTDQPGARYVLKTKEEAESYIIKLQQAFPELEWTVYQPPGGRPTCQPYERITYNRPAPNNVIERSGYIDLRFELKGDV